MPSGEEIWRDKSDAEVLAAAQRLEDYTEEGQQIITAELERRRSPEYQEAVRQADREYQRAQDEAWIKGGGARRLSLLFFLLFIPAIGFLTARLFPSAFAVAVMTASIVSAILGLGLFGLIAIAGWRARHDRDLLLSWFRPTLYVIAIVLVVVVLLDGFVLITSIAVVEMDLIEQVHGWVLLFIAIGVVMGVSAILTNAFAVVQATTVSTVGRFIPRSEAPAMWSLIDRCASQVQATAPDHLVIGLNPTFFVTEAPVSISGREVTGRTLYCSLPLARILTTAEFSAILGHELGHFVGDDTRFSQNFYPIYRGTIAAVTALEYAGGSPFRRAALVPAIAMFGYFFESFATAERGLSRSRELEADRIGASVADRPVMGSALVKVHAFSQVWGQTMAAAIDTLRNGASTANLSKTFAELAVELAPSARFETLVETQFAHPIDSHPTLATRLDALGVPLTSVENAAASVAPDDAAAGLVPNLDNCEEALSAECETLIAEELGIQRIPRPQQSHWTPIRVCLNCGTKVLPTANRRCPRCDHSMAP